MDGKAIKHSSVRTNKAEARLMARDGKGVPEPSQRKLATRRHAPSERHLESGASGLLFVFVQCRLELRP